VSKNALFGLRILSLNHFCKVSHAWKMITKFYTVVCFLTRPGLGKAKSMLKHKSIKSVTIKHSQIFGRGKLESCFNSKFVSSFFPQTDGL